MKCLHQVPLFSTLTHAELKRLEPILHERCYDAGEVVFEQGETGLGMYVVISGEIRISVRGAGGERDLARLTEGQFFGDLALLDGAERTATAVAQAPSRLIGFFRPEFMDLLETHRKVGTKLSLQLARMIGARLREHLRSDSAGAAP
ncbi:MAG: Crp/Fnr family transcriptional regulator [Candidatus Methylacidiphilales bacterium]